MPSSRAFWVMLSRRQASISCARLPAGSSGCPLNAEHGSIVSPVSAVLHGHESLLLEVAMLPQGVSADCAGGVLGRQGMAELAACAGGHAAGALYECLWRPHPCALLPGCDRPDHVRGHQGSKGRHDSSVQMT